MNQPVAGGVPAAGVAAVATSSAPVHTALPPLLALTFLCSITTGVFWTGIPFIAKHAYGFGPERNLAFSALMGGIYVVGAFSTGRLTQLLERWLSPRGVLGAVIAMLALLCLLPPLVRDEWALWTTAATVSFLASLLWPIVESYLTAGRHGHEMRSAIGWFNLVWTSAMALTMLGMAALLEHHARQTFSVVAIVNAVALFTLLGFPPRPGTHDDAASTASMTPAYPFLLRSARALLPLSYVIYAAMNPILPYRFEQLGLDTFWETPVAATWMVTRTLVMVVMWRARFWHGRWGTLLAGALAMTGGFAVVVIAPNLWMMLGGFVGFGAGMAITYYASLYYSMAVGRAAVAAGGAFEALIGLGYTIGPLAGLAGMALGGGPAVVGVVWVLVALGSLPVVAPYVRARRRGRQIHQSTSPLVNKSTSQQVQNEQRTTND